MPIVLITESLMLRSAVSDGRILRDRMLGGFCVRMHARRRTIRVATSASGKQFRMTLGYWPLMRVDEARARVLREVDLTAWRAAVDRRGSASIIPRSP